MIDKQGRGVQEVWVGNGNLNQERGEMLELDIRVTLFY